MPKKVVPLLTIFIAPILFLLGCCPEDWEGPRGDPLLITPYVNQSDMVDTVGGFSAIHHGLDFFPNGDDTPFQAAAPGRVTNVDLFYNDTADVWQVNILILYNSAYTESYAFEPCSGIDDANIQMDLITISVGQMVNAGDEIGKLHVVADHSSHVDFGLLRDWVGICPYPYFETSARDSILDLAVDGRMCDCHP